jgi:hypothetical protein
MPNGDAKTSLAIKADILRFGLKEARPRRYAPMAAGSPGGRFVWEVPRCFLRRAKSDNGPGQSLGAGGLDSCSISIG